MLVCVVPKSRFFTFVVALGLVDNIWAGMKGLQDWESVLHSPKLSSIYALDVSRGSIKECYNRDHRDILGFIIHNFNIVKTSHQLIVMHVVTHF